MQKPGTLNMADLAMARGYIGRRRWRGLFGALRSGCLLVFAVKARFRPLHFWLPASYAEAPRRWRRYLRS